ncbi:TetR/AcrR family transcriptional regulator [Zoogloea sp.]|uniref:TetR/AcrR family transcriptional regulator n=1 Tax=Zoogloea sp. TaxID=49181 RepID=UPI0035AF03B3
MSAVTPTRRQRRKEARPSELAAAALSLFIEKGFAATRLDEVAARAGVSKGTLYLYFDSKEALFKAVIEEGVLPLFDEIEAKLETLKDDPERLLKEILLDWWEKVGQTDLGGISKLIIAEAGNFPEVARYHHEAVIVRWMALLGRAIDIGIERGVFRPLDVPTLRQLVFFPLLMLSVWKNSMAGCTGPDLVSDTYFDTYFDMIFRGLLVAPREESPR